MKSCNFLNSNNQPSKLKEQLDEIYNPELALKIWNVINSEEGLNKLDWIDDESYNVAGELHPRVAKYVYNLVQTNDYFRDYEAKRIFERVTPTNKFDVDAISENQLINQEDRKASTDLLKSTIITLADKLSDRIGIPHEIINDPKQQFKGKLADGKAVINLAYATLDTPVHEIFGHSIIRSIKEQNPGLYNAFKGVLLEDKADGKLVYERIKSTYKPNERTVNHEEAVLEETLVEHLGLYTKGEIEKETSRNLFDFLRKMLSRINNFMYQLLNIKELHIKSLPDKISLKELSFVLAHHRGKVIFPGYEAIYTAPDSKQFKSYQELNDHLITNALNIEQVNVDDVDTSGKIHIIKEKEFSYFENGGKRYFTKENGKWYVRDRNTKDRKEVSEDYVLNAYRAHFFTNFQLFVKSNVRFEKGKMVVEKFLKANNIKYNPEEVFSRGQGFYSSLGAYSDLNANLLLQNLLNHIEDSEKVGDDFIVSAFTKRPNEVTNLDKKDGTLRFRLNPKSSEIKWASTHDVYSGTSNKVGSEFGIDPSEISGMSESKYPMVETAYLVSANLADILKDDMTYNNELGIALTFKNFRLEYDEGVPYSTRKLADTINSILDERYGSFVEPKISENNPVPTTITKRTLKQEAYEFINEVKNLTELEEKAIINTKLAALKKAARKVSRGLVTSEIRPIDPNDPFGKGETFFQKKSNDELRGEEPITSDSKTDTVEDTTSNNLYANLTNSIKLSTEEETQISNGTKGIIVRDVLSEGIETLQEGTTHYVQIKGVNYLIKYLGPKEGNKLGLSESERALVGDPTMSEKLIIEGVNPGHLFSISKVRTTEAILGETNTEGSSPMELSQKAIIEEIEAPYPKDGNNIAFSAGYTELLHETLLPIIYRRIVGEMKKSNKKADISPALIESIVQFRKLLIDALKSSRVKESANTEEGTHFSEMLLSALEAKGFANVFEYTLKNLPIKLSNTIIQNVKEFIINNTQEFKEDASMSEALETTSELEAIENTQISLTESIPEVDDTKSVKDFMDKANSIDKRDTLSANVRLFLSSINEVSIVEGEETWFEEDGTEELLMELFGTKYKQEFEYLLKGLKSLEYAGIPIESVINQENIKHDFVRSSTNVDEFSATITVKNLKYKLVYDSADKEVRIENYVQPLEKTYNQTKLGAFTLADTTATFQGLQKIAQNLDTILSANADMALEFKDASFRERIMKALEISDNPTMGEVRRRLLAASDQVMNELLTVLNSQYIHYRSTVFKTFNKVQVVDGVEHKTSTFSTSVTNVNQHTQLTATISEWIRRQKMSPLFEVQKDGTVSYNLKTFNEYDTKIFDLLDYKNKRTNFPVETYLEILNLFGIEVDAITLSSIIQKEKRNTILIKNYIEEAWNSIKLGVRAQERGVKGAASLHNPLEYKPVGNENKKIVNNTYIITNLIDSYSKTQAVASSHKTKDGRTVQNVSSPTYLSTQIDKIQSPLAQEKALEELNSNGFSARATWLSSQLAGANMIIRDGEEVNVGREESNKVRLGIFEQLVNADKKGRSASKEKSGFSMVEDMMNALYMYTSKTKFGTFLDTTKSDKTTSVLLENIQKVPVQSILNIDKVDGNIVVAKPGFRGLGDAYMKVAYQGFLAEVQRIIAHSKGELAEDLNLSKGGNLFYFLPNLNPEGLKSLIKEGVLTNADAKALWLKDADGKYIINSQASAEFDGANPEIKSLVEKVLMHTFKKDIGEYMAMFQDKNIQVFKRNKEGLITKALTTHIDYKYVTNMRRVINQFSLNYNTEIPTNLEEKLILNSLAIEFVANSYLVNTQMAMAFSGDPASTYKGKENMTEAQRVKVTLQEYQKRLAKDIAPGLKPNFENKTPMNTISIKDSVFNSPLSELIAAYGGKDSAADAQEFDTTLNRLEILYAMGKGEIRTRLYNEMVKIIQDAMADPNNPTNYYEFNDEQLVVFQAMKPVYVNRRNIGEATYTVDYVKSSTYMLLPQFTQGKEIDKLRVFMETHKIDRAVMDSGKKVGKKSNTVELFDGDGNFVDAKASEMSKNIDAHITLLDKDGFYVQQEVPYKEDKNKIGLVTQFDKAITSNITGIDDFQVNGETKTGIELRAERTRIIKGLNQLAYEDFISDIGGMTVTKYEPGPDAGIYTEKDTYKLNNPRRLYERLAEEAKSRDFSPNEIALLEQFTNGTLKIPLFFSSVNEKHERLVISMINKITQHKMPGKSFVQASSIGIKNVSSDIKNAKGIVYIKGYDATKRLAFMSKEAQYAEVVLPFNFFDSSGQRLYVEDFMTDGVLDPDKLPPELLELVGMRIPNQGYNSSVPIKVVGFIPHTMGDTIFIPFEMTVQMGSDFDVDKLYTYRRDYTYDETTGALSVKDVNKEEEVYVLDPALTEKEQNAAKPRSKSPREFREQEREKLQREYFEMTWGILTHPEMFDKIVQPLDKPDLVNEKKKLEGTLSSSNFFTPVTQLEYFQGHKEVRALLPQISQLSSWLMDMSDKDHIVQTYKDVANGYVPDLGIQLIKDGKLLTLNVLGGQGNTTYNYKKDNGELVSEKRNKLLNVAILQNELLYYASKRTIDGLNINKHTYPILIALLSLSDESGVILSWKEIVQILNHPITLQVVRDADGSNMFSGNKVSDVKSVLQDILSSYNESSLYKNARKSVTIEALELTHKTDLGKTEASNSIAQFLLNAYEIGNKIRTIITQLNKGTKGAGVSFIDILESNKKLEALKSTQFLSNMGSLNETIRGDDYDKIVSISIGLLPELFPYKTIIALVEKIQDLTLKELHQKDKQKFSNELKAYIMSASNLQPNSRNFMARMRYQTDTNDSLATRVLKAQRKDWAKGNKFISGLIAVTGGDTNIVSYKANINSLPTQTQSVKTDLLKLLKSLDPEKRLLAKDLIDFAYLSGRLLGQDSYAKFIPYSYLTSRGIDVKLKEILENKEAADFLNNFTHQFIKNNPNIAQYYNVISVRGCLSETFIAPILDEYGSRYLHPEYYRCNIIDRETVLYKKFVETVEGFLYVKVDTLGRGMINEYYHEQGEHVRSIYAENRVVNGVPPIS